MTLGRLTTILALASAALFAAMIYLSQTALQPEGMAMFDTRALGYDLNTARSYLGALSPEGRALYLGQQRWLDTAFPLVFSLFLAAMLWRASAGCNRPVRATRAAAGHRPSRPTARR